MPKTKDYTNESITALKGADRVRKRPSVIADHPPRERVRRGEREVNNREFLLANAGAPIRYALTKDASLLPEVLANEEVRLWLRRLEDWVAHDFWRNVHGSHDYRYVNIIGKCFNLGLDRGVAALDQLICPILGELRRRISEPAEEGCPGFGKMYRYCDGETIIAAYFPWMGYHGEDSVRYVADKRIDIVYEFARQKRYDIYREGARYPGTQKAWLPHIVDPALYRDGNIALASFPDYVLYAGMYRHASQAQRDKIETIVEWVYGDEYAQLHGNYYYYVPTDPRYKSKSINGKLHLMDFDREPLDKNSLHGLLFTCFVLSHFKASWDARWFNRALDFLNQYRTQEGHYRFPPDLIPEKKDTYAYNRLNVGEEMKSRRRPEILSTYWMERILANLCE